MGFVKKTPYMNKVLLTLFFISVISQFGNWQKHLEICKTAPQIKFISSFPDKYQIPNDKPILIDFWATWCGPCIAGLLETNDLIDEYSDKIEFIAMTDPTSRKVDQFIHSKNFKHNFLFDSTGQTFNEYFVKSIPQAFLIDRNGIIQWVGHGSKVSRNLLDEFLRNNTVTNKSIEIKNSLINQATGNYLPSHDFNLRITENKTFDNEYSYSSNFKADTFRFNSLYQSIKNTIYYLNNEKISQYTEKKFFGIEGEEKILINIYFYADGCFFFLLINK